MKKRYFALQIMALATSVLLAQPGLQWESRYNGPGAADKGSLIALDALGNIYVAGESDAPNYFSDYFLIKYNPDGDTLWTRRYNGTANMEDVPTAMKIDDNNNVYVTGKSKRPGKGFDIVTIKYNPEGVQQWLAVYSGAANLDDIAYAIDVDVAGNVYVAGSAYYNVSSTSTDGVVIKYNQAGTELWKINANQYSTNEVVNLIAINKNNGNLIVAVGQGVAYASYKLLELSPSNGSVIKVYNNNFPNVLGFPDAMVLDGLGNIFVTSTHSPYSANPTHIYTAKFNYGVPGHAWKYLRYTSYSNERQYQGIDLNVDVNSNAYILYSYYNGQYFIVRTEKLYSNGYAAWNKTFNSIPNINEHAISFKLGGDINAPDIFVTSYSSNGDISIVKYLNNGDLAWTESYDCGNNGVDVAADMAIDSMENLFITGHSSCNGTYQDIKTIKYCTTVPTAVITASGPTTFCAGGSVQLSVDTCTGCTYLWSNQSTTPSITVSPSQTTDYTVEVTSPANCSAISDPFTVTILPAPSIVITGNTNICEGESTTLSASGASNYNWTPTTGVSNPNSPSPVFTPSSTQAYTVTGTWNGCPGSASVTITVTPLPFIDISGPDSICAGNSAQLTASGAESYSWTPASTLSDPNIYNPVATPATTTPYSVTGTTNGCSATATKTLTVVPLPNVQAITCGDMCIDETCQLEGTGAASYSWSPGSNLSDPSVYNPEFTPPSTGVYTLVLTGTSQEGCSSKDTVTIAVNLPPDVFIVVADTVLCTGDSTLLTAYGAETYSWFPTYGLSDPGAPVTWAKPLVSGTYTYTVTGSKSGCEGEASVNIQVNQRPTITVIVGDSEICIGESVSLQAFGATSFIWSPATGLSDPNSSNPIASPVQTTTYTATGMLNGCDGWNSVTITVKTPPGLPGFISGPGTVCSLDTLSYSVPLASDANEYIWELPYGWVQLTQGNAISVIASDQSGDISVSTENECGESDSRVFSVSATPTPPKPTITPSAGILTSSPASGYQWYIDGTPAATSQSIGTEQSGVYWVVVTLNGCSSEPSAPVIINSTAEVEAGVAVEIFPNPTDGILNVRGSGITNGPCFLRLTHSLGQMIWEREVALDGGGFATQLDLNDLPSGVYFLNFRSAQTQKTYLVQKL